MRGQGEYSVQHSKKSGKELLHMDDMELQTKIQELRERRKTRQDTPPDTFDPWTPDPPKPDKPERPDGVLGVVTVQGILVVSIAIIYVLMSTFFPSELKPILRDIKGIIATDFSFSDMVYETVGGFITELNGIDTGVEADAEPTLPVADEPITDEPLTEPADDADAAESTPVSDATTLGAGGEHSENVTIMLPDNATLASAIYTGSIAEPLVQGRISSNFGFRDSPITGKFEFHNAMDIAANTGTAIYAAADGKVITATKGKSLGNYIVLDHGNGFRTKYGHCSKLLVTEGTVVREGEVIALVGSTGDSTGPHLHFAASKNGIYFDPAYLYRYVSNCNWIVV